MKIFTNVCQLFIVIGSLIIVFTNFERRFFFALNVAERKRGFLREKKNFTIKQSGTEQKHDKTTKKMHKK